MGGMNFEDSCLQDGVYFRIMRHLWERKYQLIRECRVKILGPWVALKIPMSYNF